MKQSKEQIEAYRTMAKQAPQSMNDIIKQHLTENCPKFKENEDKFDRRIKHLYETVLEMLGGRDAADDDNTLSGQVPADTVFRICRDYFDDELWKKEDEEAAKEKAENEKRAEAIRQKDTEIRRLTRALWLARAGEAAKEVNYWTCENASSYAIVDFNVHHETIISYKAPHHRPYKWIQIWENVERKCRAKAEEYK